jgi:hypothetical protein
MDLDIDDSKINILKITLTIQQIMKKFLSFEKNQRFLLNFGALSANLFLKIFPARQVSEIILNEC